MCKSLRCGVCYALISIGHPITTNRREHQVIHVIQEKPGEPGGVRSAGWQWHDIAKVVLQGWSHRMRLLPPLPLQVYPAVSWHYFCPIRSLTLWPLPWNISNWPCTPSITPSTFQVPGRTMWFVMLRSHAHALATRVWWEEICAPSLVSGAHGKALPPNLSWVLTKEQECVNAVHFTLQLLHWQTFHLLDWTDTCLSPEKWKCAQPAALQPITSSSMCFAILPSQPNPGWIQHSTFFMSIPVSNNCSYGSHREVLVPNLYSVLHAVCNPVSLLSSPTLHGPFANASLPQPSHTFPFLSPRFTSHCT